MTTLLTSRARVVRSPGGFGRIVQIRGIMCSDGVRRVTSYCGVPDTFFSLPCRVQVKGVTVSGLASQLRRSDDSHDWQFHARESSANGDCLPRESVYAFKRNGCGSLILAEPAGYLSVKAGAGLWNEESGEFFRVVTVWPGSFTDRTPWRAEIERDGWTQAVTLES